MTTYRKLALRRQRRKARAALQHIAHLIDLDTYLDIAA